MITISPSVAGFIKGILGAVVLVAVSYLASAANLNGIMNPTLAFVVAGIFSGLESRLKANSGGDRGLFGAVKIK